MSTRRKIAAQRETRASRKALINATGTAESTIATVSLIEKLPNELIGQIFEHYVCMDQPPWCLLMVSEKWKAVAVANPRLWTHISILKSPGWGSTEKTTTTWHIPGQSQPVESLGRRQVCTTEIGLRAALSLSGVTPIHIWYQWRDGWTPGPQGLLLLKIVLERSVASRMAALFINPYYGNIISLIDQLPRNHFPRLLSIGFFPPFYIPQTYLQNLHQTAPHLRELELHQAEALSIASVPVLEHIQVLRVNSERITLNVVTEIMRHCPRLVELADHGLGWLLSDSEGEFEPSPYGRNERSIGDIAQLDLSLLKSLSFMDSADYATHQMISLPQVTSLSLRLKDIRLLRYLDAPSLTKLKISTFTQYKEPEFIGPLLNGIQFPNVVTFRMQSHFRERFFAEILHSFPNAQIIHFVQLGHQSPFSDHAIFSELVLTDGRGPCKRLERMTIGTEKYPVHFRKMGMGRLIDPVVASREEAGIVLPRFVIHWSDPATSQVEILSLP